MASAPAGARSDRPSFAKIAATGLKPPSARSNNTPGNIQQHGITSAPREGLNTVIPSNGLIQTAQPKKLVQLGGNEKKDPNSKGSAGLEVHVHNVDGASQQAHGPTAAIGLLAPATSEDSATQVSSSTDSVKPSSLDGKSVASGTTFALDEKESLRPDDSASVKAADDEDVFSPPMPGLVASHIESEEEVRAFRDQLREITSMEPPARGITPQGFRPSVNPQQGVLYVPPHGLGVGLVPGSARGPNPPSNGLDMPPDPKLLEALDSPRDRVWVLKLEQDVFDFVKDAKEASLNLPQCNAYHRMLAHKIADYYMLGHIVDDSASAVRLYKTPNCRIAPPLTGITTPSTAANTPPPTAPHMKILRRGEDVGPAIANGSNMPSKSGSETGESDDDRKAKLPASREEREARYEAARLRIMGSSKPSGSPEELKLKDDSRSSSVAGKKSKKKQRPDSDDGFEARSAYFQQSNSYYTPPYGASAFNSTSYGFPATSEAAHGHVATPSTMNNQEAAQGFQSFSAQAPGNIPWPAQAYVASNGVQPWPQTQQPGFDLAGNFQQAMSLHSPVVPAQAPNMTPSYDSSYQQQFYSPQQTWPQQDYSVRTQPSQPNSSALSGYQQRPISSTGRALDLQNYQFGQLPSQTFPGRAASNLEHPLPGSYKGKHFNPQSQAFVPGQQSTAPFRPFTPQGVIVNTPGFGGASPLQRQASTQSQSVVFGSPHHHAAPSAAAQVFSHPMMHPLPQPVFPQQPSPSLPLPPKPGSTPQKSAQSLPSQSPHAATGQSPSSISKWGAPASLPAKPPPPAEPFDPARFAQLQRQPSYNAAAAARVPSGGMPSFGSMPPTMAGGMGVDGMGARRQ
ncbi:hypothetical protein LTR36_004964 [Oleoguttula mirabilis]|uniref:R3H domain-containing protein 2 n=1 Tax=Oleoguttula mirabilis TaxID=1507867 RepID=A0AAV9JX79_9PEZI|nr:hypothetical protein LTR36_004964 [Oleoguttula mirabilis]